jgi:fumarate reductase flavoprotein subunit
MGGPVASHALHNGIFSGKAKNGPVKVEVDVTIQDHRIAGITLTKHRNWKGRAAEEVIPRRIIDEQSTRVDVVSGATASSTAIMNAVEAAIRKSQAER